MGALIQPVQDLLGSGCMAVAIGVAAVLAARHMRMILRILGIDVEDWRIDE